MKPFDLDAAKAGALFYRYGDPTVPLRYIGVRRSGSIVCENDASSPVTVFGSEIEAGLRMCAHKVVKYGLVRETDRGPQMNADLYDAPSRWGGVPCPGYHIVRIEWDE